MQATRRLGCEADYQDAQSRSFETRRAELLKFSSGAKNKSWAKPKLLDLLMKSPIKDPACVAFITGEVRRCKEEMLASNDEERLLSERISKAGQWRTPTTFLRLIHVLCKDDIKPHFLRCFDARTRLQQDGCDPKPSVYQKIADK